MSDILHIVAGGPPDDWLDYEVQVDGVRDNRPFVEVDVLGCWARLFEPAPSIRIEKIYGNFTIHKTR